MLVLTALPYSPWSEKARWALDHHRMEYREEEHIPLLGDIKLRLRLRRPTGRVTVPVLYDGSAWLTDSFDIAQYADRLGGGPRLFPVDKVAEVTAWNQRSEAAMAAGRAWLMLASANDPNVALAALPPGMPSALKPLLLPFAKKGLQLFIAKYRMRDGESSHKDVFMREFDALSKALSGRRYLLGDAFSYADIAMAVALQAVSPVDERYMRRLPGFGAEMDGGELRRRYQDLIEWRDELYEKHRRPAAQA
jgi:glutathione S-transferase